MEKHVGHLALGALGVGSVCVFLAQGGAALPPCTPIFFEKAQGRTEIASARLSLHGKIFAFFRSWELIGIRKYRKAVSFTPIFCDWGR